MKIKIKKVVEDEITIPNLIKIDDYHFQDTINYILGLEFIATSCVHYDIHSLFGHSQGGGNTNDIVEIELVDDMHSKRTYKLTWAGHSKEHAYLIARVPS